MPLNIEVRQLQMKANHRESSSYLWEKIMLSAIHQHMLMNCKSLDDHQKLIEDKWAELSACMQIRHQTNGMLINPDSPE